MFDDFKPELLYADFVAYSSPEHRDELARQCRAKVVEWRWGNCDMAFAFRRPFAKELYRVDPRWLSDGKKPKPGNMRHGLDSEGTIHVVEDLRFRDTFDENHITPTYVTYGHNMIEAIRYRTPGHLESIQRRIYVGDRLIRQDSLVTSNRGSEQHYEWDGERLSRILNLCWETDRIRSELETLPGFKVTSFTEECFIFDELERLDRIEQHYLNDDGSINNGLPTQIVYQRPKKNESIRQLAKEIERMLVEQLPPAAATVRGKGPFYCLFLCYCAEDFGASWPPVVMLKTEAERQRILKRGEEVTYYLWAPDESDDTNVYVPLKNTSLRKHCELHSQLMEVKGDYSSGTKALRGVANALNELDWPKIIDVTPDFVVAAVDNTGEIDFASDIKACVPAKAFRALKQRGLI